MTDSRQDSTAPSLRNELTRCLPPAGLKALRHIGRLAEGGAYLVGGAVRDAILGRMTRDLDVVVTGSIAGLGLGLGGETVAHDAFGTATVTLENGIQIDLARSRTESYSHPAALPRVRPATLLEDLARRDFTVNAMAVHLAPRGFGRLHDPQGGLDDLEKRVIRVLHDLSFIDDPTRAFRAVEFSARLGFEIEPGTARLIRAAIREGVFDRLSAARLRKELERLLGGAHRTSAVRGMVSLGLLRTIDPGLRARSGLHSRVERVGPTLAWYRSLVGRPEVAPWLIAFGVLLQGLEPSRLSALLDRIQPGRRGRRVLGEVLDRPPRLATVLDRPAIPASAIFEACRDRPAEVLLLTSVLSRKRRVRGAVRRYLETLAGTTPDIGGRDLLAAGMKPGPAIAAGLAAALREKLDGRAQTARSQLEAALRSAGRA